jgi:predicted O-methyltransferase YrrM
MDLHQRKFASDGGDWEWFTEFVGVPMSCNYYLFHLMSRALREQPQVRGIMEFGTYTGSMAVYLGLEAAQRGIPCSTFEIQPVLAPSTERLLRVLGVQIHVGDIFDPAHKAQIRTMLSRFPVYLLVDNGDKPREFAEFVPMLQSGSVVAVHDYEMEFFDRDWAVHSDKVTPYMQEEWRAHNVQCAHFIVR